MKSSRWSKKEKERNSKTKIFPVHQFEERKIDKKKKKQKGKKRRERKPLDIER